LTLIKIQVKLTPAKNKDGKQIIHLKKCHQNFRVLLPFWWSIASIKLLD